jgi:alanyl-tRNA synthetase
LYYTDAYLREFEAMVVDRSAEGTRLYLDRTAFYPTSGGQPFDTGSLDGVPVVDVVDEGDRIVHVLAAPHGDPRVTGRIDWARRFDHMQQHTGQHLLSAVFADLMGHQTVGVHFGPETSTLDLDTDAIPPERVVEAERRANEVVTENRPVRVSFENASGAGGLRKASDREGVLRIVTIEDFDRSACGGTHVAATGEIGLILIGKVERVKQQVRLEFLCGARAVRSARGDHDLVAAIAASLTATPAEVPALIQAHRAELKRATVEARELGERLAGYRAAELYASASPGDNGRRTIVLRGETGGIEQLRMLGQAVARLPGAIFIAVTGDRPTVLLATAADSRVDAGRILKTALDQVAGRGGGNARLAQGTVADQSAAETVIRSIVG